MNLFEDVAYKKLDKNSPIKMKPKAKIPLADKPWMSRAIRNSVKTKKISFINMLVRKKNNRKRKLYLTSSEHTLLT